MARIAIGRSGGHRIIGALCAASALAACATATAHAAPGDLDPTFGAGGVTTTLFDVPGGADAVAMTRMPDGRIVMAGSTEGGPAITRLRPDGTVDTTFGGGGSRILPEHFAVGDVAVGPDGSVVVALSVEQDDGFDIGVTRLRADGSVDEAFGAGGTRTIDFGGNDWGNGIAVLPDGRVVVAGSGGDVSNDVVLARLSTTGALDPTFSGDGKARTTFGPFLGASDLVVQPDGKVLAAASGREDGFAPDLAVARFRTDGELDPTFDGDGRQTIDGGASSNEDETSVALDGDGRILLAGRGLSYGPGPTGGNDTVVARLLPDGAPDTTFGGDGSRLLDLGRGDQATDVAADGGGRVLLTVLDRVHSDGTTTAEPSVVRLTQAGVLDASFDGDGVARPGDGRLHAVLADGSGVLAAGGFTARPGMTLLRLTADGTPHAQFGDAGRAVVPFPAGAQGSALELLPDGRLLAVGDAGGRIAVARYTASGALDPSFDEDGRVAVDAGSSFYVVDAVTDASGRIVVVGTVDGAIAAARLTAAGALDPAFGSGGVTRVSPGDWRSASGVAVLPDGDVAISGTAGSSFGGGDAVVVRLDATGRPDASFSGDGIAVLDAGDSEAGAVAAAPDGTIVIAGTSGQDAVLARVRADGTLDPAFSGDGLLTVPRAGTTSRATLSAVVVLADGSVAAAGDDRGDALLVRADAAGGPVDGFGTAGVASLDLGGTYDGAAALRLDGADRLVVAGVGAGRMVVARVLADGRPDPAFAGDGVAAIPVASSSSIAQAVRLQPDGRIIAAGTAFGTPARFALARLQVSSTPPPPADTTPPSISVGRPLQGQRFAQGEQVASEFRCTDTGGSGLASCTGPATIDTSTSGERTFTVRATDAAGNTAVADVRYGVDPPSGDGDRAHGQEQPTGERQQAGPGRQPEVAGAVQGPATTQVEGRTSTGPAVRVVERASAAVLARGLAVRVAGAKPRSTVVIRVRRGSHVIGTSRSRVDGAGTSAAKVQVRRSLVRRLRPGTALVVVVSMTEPSGRKVTRTTRLRVR